MRTMTGAELYRGLATLRTSQLRRAVLCVALAAASLLALVTLGRGGLAPAAAGYVLALLLLPFRRPVRRRGSG